MKHRFIVKVGEKTFPVEVGGLEEETVACMESPSITPAAKSEAPAPSVEGQSRPREKVDAVAGSIRSSLPSKTVSIKCKVRDNIKTAETALVLEGMKRETTMAPKSGRVKEIPASDGDNVTLENVLLVIE